MKKKSNVKIWTKTATVLLVFLMAAELCACGGKKKEEQQAPKEEPAVTAEAVETPTPEITPEAVEEKTEQQEVKQEETPSAETPAEEPAKEEEKDSASEAPQETEVIKKPEAVDTVEPEEKTEKEADEKGKKEKKEASSDGLALLDGKMVFDGMELEFPIELDGMKLGNWKIEYQNVEDPESKTLMPGEIVTAVMTNEAFLADDVTVIAEFGNYSNEDTDLTDLPMSGIYITKGKGKDGKEPVLPEVVMPGGLTWGSTESEIRDLFGEASLSGTFNMDFDFMYENGEYMVEFGGMNDTGITYIVYCEE